MSEDRDTPPVVLSASDIYNILKQLKEHVSSLDSKMSELVEILKSKPVFPPSQVLTRPIRPLNGINTAIKKPTTQEAIENAKRLIEEHRLKSIPNKIDPKKTRISGIDEPEWLGQDYPES